MEARGCTRANTLPFPLLSTRAGEMIRKSWPLRTPGFRFRSATGGPSSLSFQRVVREYFVNKIDLSCCCVVFFVVSRSSGRYNAISELIVSLVHMWLGRMQNSSVHKHMEPSQTSSNCGTGCNITTKIKEMYGSSTDRFVLS